MTPEEQAEFLNLKKRAEEAETKVSALTAEVGAFKAENEKLSRVNQEYFLRLSATPVPPKDEEADEDKEDSDDYVAEPADFVEFLLKKEK